MCVIEQVGGRRDALSSSSQGLFLVGGGDQRWSYEEYYYCTWTQTQITTDVAGCHLMCCVSSFKDHYNSCIEDSSISFI